MTSRIFNRTAIAGAVAAMFTSIAACAATGPSSSATPYLTAVEPGVQFTSILTVGDSVRLKNKGNQSYRMTGIPDGLGAYRNDDGTITVLMNHELNNAVGITRAHGGKGAFISQWQIRLADLKVLNGRDLIDTVNLWNNGAYETTSNAVFNRFCSADLPQPGAFYNSATGKGFNEGRIYTNGEETSGGRAFAHLAAGRQHGTTYELPKLGRASWESLVASPLEQDKTIVAGLDDGSLNASKLFFYVGEKQTEGSPIEQAGLTNGATFAVNVDGFTTESGASPIPNGYSGSFSLVASGGTGLNRVEDGAWDTLNPNRFYFVTTASFAGNSRLWRVTFQDIHNPAAGGLIEVLVDGAVAGPKMMDNITVDANGDVYLQEDVGNNPHIGKIWKYSANGGALTLVAQHDENRFVSGAPGDIDGSDAKQSDEESSGIIEVTGLLTGEPGYDTEAKRYFLLDVQAHYASVNGVAVDPELVEGGQLLMMAVPR